MENILKLPRAQRSVVSELKLSIPAALISAHFFVGFREEESYVEIFLVSGYFPALIASAIISFAIIMGVKIVTRWLDRISPWKANKWYRLLLQFLFGGILIFLFEFALSSAYFVAQGISLMDTIYFDSYMLPIVMFIFLVNGYYNSGYPPELRVSVPVTDRNIDNHQTNVDLAKYSEIQNVAYISISGRHHYAQNGNGDAIIWEYTIENSVAALPDNYYQITRNTIVRRDIIVGVTQDVKNREVYVELKPGFGKSIKVPTQNIVLFEQWWYGI